MAEIVFTCAKHGKLTRDKVNKNGTKFRCKQCNSDAKKAHYERNKETILAKQKQYREENEEKVRQIKSESRKKHWHKYRVKHRITNADWRIRHRDVLRMRDREKKQRYRDTEIPCMMFT